MCTLARMALAPARVAAFSARPQRRRAATRLATLLAFLIAMVMSPAPASAGINDLCGPIGEYSTDGAESCTFSWPDNAGAAAAFQVPAGVTELGLKLVGAQGGDAPRFRTCNAWAGGAGAVVTGTASVTPGTMLTVIVGGKGASPCPTSAMAVPGGAGGYGGGGRGGDAGFGGGGGGGASRVYSSISLFAVAGGGGGGGGSFGLGGDAGQSGQGAGTVIYGAGGAAGTQTAGGAPGVTNFDYTAQRATQATAGSFGAGGNGGSIDPVFGNGGGGGGGGGYYGGGGGGPARSFGGGGGGGSSFTGGMTNATVGTASETPKVIISWNRTAPGPGLRVGNATTGATWWEDTDRVGDRAYAFASALPSEVDGRIPTGTFTLERFAGAGCAGTPLSSETVALDAYGNATSANSPQLGAGAHSYRAVYSGDLFYLPFTSCVDFVASKYPQALRVSNPTTSATYGDRVTPSVEFTSPLGPTAHPAITRSVSSASAGVCRLDGDTLVMIGVGDCEFQASAPGDDTYEPAPAITQRITVGKASARIDVVDATIRRNTPAPSQPFVTKVHADDLVNGDDADQVERDTTGTPDCEYFPHSTTVPGTYPGVMSCTPGSLSHPNYTFVQGRAGDLTVVGGATVTITPESKDLGTVDRGAATTYEVQYLAEGDDVLNPQFTVDTQNNVDVQVSGLPSIIHDGETVTLTVSVTPNETGPFRASVFITGDFDQRNGFEFTGTANVVYDGGKAFQRSRLLSAPASLDNVVVGTFDRDPYPDLAAASLDQGVFIMRGRGNGTFLDPVQVVGTGGSFDEGGLASGDLDGDGDIDLTTGKWILYNDGDGNFTDVRPTMYSNAKDVGVADLNADGTQDLVLFQGNETTLIFRGEGRTTVNEITYPLPAETGSVADVDRDGDPDIAAVIGEDSADGPVVALVLLRNDGDGVFTEERHRFTPAQGPGGSGSASVSVGDFNGDLIPDISVGFGFFPGRADGSLGAFSYPLGFPFTGGIAGDFDGDKRDETLVSLGGTVYLFRGATFDADGTPTGIDVDLYPLGMSGGMGDIAAGDFDRDGRMDAVVAQGGAGLSLLLNGRGEPNRDRLAAKITEVRFGDDPYVKVVNTRRDSVLRMDGWRFAFSNGLRVTMPLSAPVPPGGSVFIGRPKNAGGSLAPYVRSVEAMPRDLVGVRLDGADSTPADAVGFDGDATDYKEGTALTEAQFIGQGAYVRRSVAGRPQDTEDNAADFVAVDTRANEGSGTILGAPRPDRWDGPTNRNDILQSTLVDPSQPSSAAPNRVSGGGYLTINRRITNCSGGLTDGACRNADPSQPAVKVTKLRFRVTALSTYGTSPTGALLRLVASDDATVGALGIKGLPLDGPSLSTGGGLNSSQTATPLLPAGGLAPGESINVAFRFKIDRAGTFTFGYDTEDDVIALPKPAAPPAAEEKVPDAAPVPEVAKGTVPLAAEALAAGGATPAAGTPGPAVKAPATGAKAPAAKKCVTKKQLKKLRGKARKRAKLCAPAKKAPQSVKRSSATK